MIADLTLAFDDSRKAARILLTLDENDPRRLFEGKFLLILPKDVCVSYALPILNMIITLIISIQVRLSSEEW